MQDHARRKPDQERATAGTQPAKQNQVVIAPWRIYTVLGVSVLIVMVIVVRLVDVQVVQHATLLRMARNEINREITIQPDRGMITDSRGNVLALDVERESVWVNPSQIQPDRAPRLALTLSTLLSKDARDILRTLTREDLQWVRLARWLKPTVAEQVALLNEPGLHLVYEPRRFYPQETFAAHVIGAVNYNGDGFVGIEGYYDEYLKGEPGSLQAEFDSSQNPIAIAPQHSRPARNGGRIQLTIDPMVQYVAETALQDAVQEHEAAGGSILVIEPSTGAIRAMANCPPFDPNHYTDYPEATYGRNPAISTLYEPGSTFKIVTAAAGLQSRSFTADTFVDDTGIINRFDIQIHNWNSLGNGMINAADMLYYSSNIGAVKLNELTGADQFYPMVYDFGFGSPTGIDLSGEEAGLVHDPSSPLFDPTRFLINSYGQGIAATPLQIVQAAAVIANDGILMKPYVVARRCREGGSLDEQRGNAALAYDETWECEETNPTVVRQVVEPGVAWTIRRMLVQSANHYAPIVWQLRNGSLADQWLVPGYEVGAKTGTASIPTPGGGYDPRYVIGSVVGFAPAEDARYAVLVKIDKPERDAWGLASAVPAFTQVVEELMRYERIAPDPSLFSPGQ
jgi:cell division protein FtsI/penicillin-binding protein 2